MYELCRNATRKPGRLSGYRYQEFEMKHQNIWKKHPFVSNEHYHGDHRERANDVASEWAKKNIRGAPQWYLVTLLPKSPGCR